SNDGWTAIGCMSFISQPIIAYSDEIRSAVLIIHGEKAHSCYFSKDEFEKLTGDNKELLIIPDAVHTDLYDDMEIIPFDKIEEFYNQYL
ncbi:MAG: alpha/beta hydrolase, partial [Methanobrevibacter sp.]|nr:alpha/beta hydrolase [Methanobrevibacter sp.]